MNLRAVGVLLVVVSGSSDCLPVEMLKVESACVLYVSTRAWE